MHGSILLIEDVIKTSEGIARIMEVQKVEVVWAPTGKIGLERLAKEKFDLVLCDVNLPDIDGFEILKKAKADRRLAKIPFIFLSAYASDEDVKEGIDKGADGYITKPFLMKTLVETISYWLHLQPIGPRFGMFKQDNAYLQKLQEGFTTNYQTPLEALLTASSLLQKSRSTQTIASAQTLITEIEKSAAAVLHSTKKLVTYFRLLYEPQTIWVDGSTGTTDVAALLRKIVDHQTQAWPYLSKAVTISGNETTMVSINTEYLELILVELLENMLVHTTDHETIRVVLHCQQGSFAASFVNQAKETTIEWEQIVAFQCFHSGTQKRLGLGLFVVKELCRLLSLDLQVYHEDNFLSFRLEYTETSL